MATFFSPLKIIYNHTNLFYINIYIHYYHNIFFFFFLNFIFIIVFVFIIFSIFIFFHFHFFPPSFELCSIRCTGQIIVRDRNEEMKKREEESRGGEQGREEKARRDYYLFFPSFELCFIRYTVLLGILSLLANLGNCT